MIRAILALTPSGSLRESNFTFLVKLSNRQSNKPPQSSPLGTTLFCSNETPASPLSPP
jgi:hypothetical protein